MASTIGPNYVSPGTLVKAQGSTANKPTKSSVPASDGAGRTVTDTLTAPRSARVPDHLTTLVDRDVGKDGAQKLSETIRDRLSQGDLSLANASPSSITPLLP